MFEESQLLAAIENLTKRIEALENMKDPEPSSRITVFSQINFDYDMFGDVQTSDWETFERPFDNVRAIFDRETGNLEYIGLIDDLPF
jgi:hypothetical protein